MYQCASREQCFLWMLLLLLSRGGTRAVACEALVAREASEHVQRSLGLVHGNHMSLHPDKCSNQRIQAHAVTTHLRISLKHRRTLHACRHIVPSNWRQVERRRHTVQTRALKCTETTQKRTGVTSGDHTSDQYCYNADERPVLL